MHLKRKIGPFKINNRLWVTFNTTASGAHLQTETYQILTRKPSNSKSKTSIQTWSDWPSSTVFPSGHARRLFTRYNNCNNNKNWSTIITKKMGQRERNLRNVAVKETANHSQKCFSQAVLWCKTDHQIIISQESTVIVRMFQATADASTKHRFKDREMRRARKDLAKAKGREVWLALIRRSTRALLLLSQQRLLITRI